MPSFIPRTIGTDLLIRVWGAFRPESVSIDTDSASQPIDRRILSKQDAFESTTVVGLNALASSMKNKGICGMDFAIMSVDLAF